jgi:hypothetical protein
MDQFSKIVLSFERKNGSGTMSPVEVGLGETIISLSPGTWEITASAYNKADPPVVTAQAKNTLTRTGELIEGNTYFALTPAGTGPGILRYTITPPEGLVLEGDKSFIRLMKDGADPGGDLIVPISGAIAGAELSLEDGCYTVNIVLDDSKSIRTAVFWEAALILPGLVTELVFAPQSGDFLDPAARATLTGTAWVNFGKTTLNSSLATLGAPGGSEVNKTQGISVPPGVEAVYFTLSKAANQSITIGGQAAAKVSMTTNTTVDGRAASDTLAIFTVDTADLADPGGEREFTLTLGENGKTPIVYAVTVSIPVLIELETKETEYSGMDSSAWPSKWVYVLGEEFDPTGLILWGAYSDGKVRAVTGGYTVEGFDTSSVGEKFVQIQKYGVIAQDVGHWEYYLGNPIRVRNYGFTIEVISDRRLTFDPEIEAGHIAEKIIGVKPNGLHEFTHDSPPPSGYTVSPGRTVVLAPFKWHIPDDAVYEWTVNGAAQASATEYLAFAYSSFGPGDHTVTVTAKINGSAVATASTTVSCVSGAPQRPVEETSKATAEKLFTVLAPGQFGSEGGRLGRYHGAGGFGGYGVFRFDHSIPRNGVNGKEFKVGGNTGVWTEPGAIWVSMDENNNGEPDDTWYECKGSHTFVSSTIRRYAVTFRDDYTWIDNLGGGGFYPQIQAFRPWDHPEVTLTGTRLDKGLVGMAGVWGYADVYDDERVSISNAVQVDGTDANLPFIDFVKFVTAIHHADGMFGERSPEAGTPTDVSMNDPEMLMSGKSNGGATFSYTFNNDSGYDLIINFEGVDFSLPRKGTTTTTVTKQTTSANIYLDFRGGNVDFTIFGSTATYVNGPEE